MIKVYYLGVNSGLNKTKARMLNMNAWMLNIVDLEQFKGVTINQKFNMMLSDMDINNSDMPVRNCTLKKITD